MSRSPPWTSSMIYLREWLCLDSLIRTTRVSWVQKVRSKIAVASSSREVDGVWVYNRSSYPIFIKPATLDNPDSRTLLVHKVFPGFSIKALTTVKAYSLQRSNDSRSSMCRGPGFTVQISFVKGWGQCYTRQFISSCPCWLEVIFYQPVATRGEGRAGQSGPGPNYFAANISS